MNDVNKLTQLIRLMSIVEGEAFPPTDMICLLKVISQRWNLLSGDRGWLRERPMPLVDKHHPVRQPLGCCRHSGVRNADLTPNSKQLSQRPSRLHHQWRQIKGSTDNNIVTIMLNVH